MKKVILSIVGIFLVVGMAVSAADLVIESKTQSFSEKDNKIKFQDDVKVSVDDVHVVGDKADVQVNKDNKLDVATFYDKPYAYEIKENKKREVKANILKVSLINKTIRAEGDVQTTVLDGKQPVVMITANSQEYDTKTNVMKADGGVAIKYKELDTFSDHAVIHTDQKGELKKIDLIGNAQLKEKKNISTADHFIYNAVTEELIAMGKVHTIATMEDKKTLVIKSGYQQYDKKANTFTASGNAKIWYDDYFAEGPKVTCYPDNKTKKPNEIYFSGRSSITQKDKTIYADKIKMVFKPKTFYAEGHTKSVIRDISSDNGEDDSPFAL